MGYENGRIGSISLSSGNIKDNVGGHEGSVNAMGINLTNSNLYTCGSDGVLNVWQ